MACLVSFDSNAFWAYFTQPEAVDGRCSGKQGTGGSGRWCEGVGPLLGIAAFIKDAVDGGEAWPNCIWA